MQNLVGKTVAKVEYIDPWDIGLTILFTDGTKLLVTEYSQAGQIMVELNGERVRSDVD